MKWFPGSINEAVATSKARKAVFVVFIAGDDDVSREAAKAIDTPEISSYLEKDDFVAIRLESGSESYRFFAQIYQLVPVPSLFFIGNNGTPLEVIADGIKVPVLKEKIDGVLAKVAKSANSASNSFIQAEQSSSSAQQSSESNTNVASPPQSDATPSGSSDETHSVLNNSEAPEENASQISMQEKVEHARKLIELQKRQKMEKEREEEKRREKERREMGKLAQNMRRQQQDLDIAAAHEERMKEKAAELQARERVRQQIAQDKLERKHREMDILKQSMSVQEENTNPQPSSSAVTGDDVVRIQFRLPSGNPHLGKFDASITLREMRAYVVNNIELPFRQFSLSTSFPRRDLTVDEDDKTLLELELIPTSVILILPIKSSSSSTTAVSVEGGFLFRFVWALIAPILTVYNYLVGYFIGAPAGANSRSNDSSGADGSNSETHNNVDPADKGRSLGGTTVRARGNIHRLHSSQDDNDENNTWNGNSTQQM